MSETGHDIEEELTAKANELDELQVEVPPMTQFTAMVRTENKREQKSQRLQFVAFLLVAATAMLLLTVMWNLYQTVFIVLECVLLGVSLIAAVVSLISMIRVRSKQ